MIFVRKHVKRMNFLVAFGLMTVAEIASAADPLLVTKIYSRACGPTAHQGDIEFRGSGILFRRESGDPFVYVLSSDHVVLTGNRATNGVCHSVGISEGLRGGRIESGLNLANAELVASDWYRGLSLLKLEPEIVGINVALIPVLENLSNNASETVRSRLHQGSVDVLVQGFPYREQQTLHEAKGVMRKLGDNVYRDARQYGAVIIEKSHAEIGMSGGPVSDSNGMLLGILTHRFPASMGFTKSLKFNLISISMDVIGHWLDEIFAGSPRTGIVRDAADQLRGRDILYTGGLRFEAVPISNRSCTGIDVTDAIGGHDPVGIGGHDPVGIGGHDPVGIGGHDPVGIGGRQKSVKREIAVYVTVDSLSSERMLQTAWPYPRLSKWFTDLRNQITNTGWAIVHPIKSKSLPPRERQCYESLEEYFRKMPMAESSPSKEDGGDNQR